MFSDECPKCGHEKYNKKECFICRKDEDIAWLKERQSVIETITKIPYEIALVVASAEIAQLKQTIASAREVISWYGDKFNWGPEFPGASTDNIIRCADIGKEGCGGFRARKWLSEHKVD